MIKRLGIAVMLTALGCTPAVHAEVSRVGVHVATHHFTGEWNDFNPGIYAELKNGVTAGVYLNSESRTSAYLGYTFRHQFGQSWDLTATLGAITGYHKPLQPLLIPSLSRAVGSGYRIRVAFVPQIHRNGSAGIHAMIEREIN